MTNLTREVYSTMAQKSVTAITNLGRQGPVQKNALTEILIAEKPYRPTQQRESVL